jgi:hypothetical protein
MLDNKNIKHPKYKISKSGWYLITMFEEYDRSLVTLKKFITQNPKRYEGNKYKFQIQPINVK